MPIPAVVVRTAREVWQCQWRQLMKGLGPADRDGHYRRPPSARSALPPLPDDAGSPGAAVLIVGRSCPWAHRAWLAWTLRQLQGSIALLVVEPDPQAGRWIFPTPFEGCQTLAELYRRSGCPASARATVPLLWSCSQKRILVNESARLIELLDRWPQGDPRPEPPGPPDAPAHSAPAASGAAPGVPSPAGPEPPVPEPAEPESKAATAAEAESPVPRPAPPLAAGALCPPETRQRVEWWRERLQGAVNDGVYRCGLARSQQAYDAAEAELFAALDELEHDLASREPGDPGWLAGGADPSLADLCLFPTLIRWEQVYAPLFGCSRRPLWQFPRLWRWRARFHGLPGVAATCRPEAWRRDYFGALFPLHPSGLIPAGPDLATLVNSVPLLPPDDLQQPPSG
ncbi:MAG: glutathione S-transferase C-terminal domain-containing protein [Synechococcaceae cyanobacterium]|nr:glutathione S-transferase C-terminal domain-containing protein [Synechococcaceae cyanobacterium]